MNLTLHFTPRFLGIAPFDPKQKEGVGQIVTSADLLTLFSKLTPG